MSVRHYQKKEPAEPLGQDVCVLFRAWPNDVAFDLIITHRHPVMKSYVCFFVFLLSMFFFLTKKQMR